MVERLKFIKELNKFKLIKRKTYNLDGSFESDSDHSWHLALFVITYKDILSKTYDYEKLLELALVHDLPEIYTGDFHPFGEAPKNKFELEKIAIEKLNSILPVEPKKEFDLLFKEYELNNSKESILIKSLDKLMPLITEISNFSKNKSAYKEIEVDEHMCYEYILDFIKDNIFLRELFEELFREAKEKKIFFQK